MASHHRILLVEDDPSVRALLSAYLIKEGFEVSEAENARQFHSQFSRERIDLVLLDLNLPDEDGFVLARSLRQKSAVPMIMVTSREQTDDRIHGLEMGADDYVSKPFDPRELIARIRSLLRRSQTGGMCVRAANSRTFADYVIDLDRHLLSRSDGRPVRLTRAEFDLLAALALADGRVLSRDQLIDAVSRRDEPPLDRTIDVIISRLRRKIEDDPRRPEILVTVPAYGYRLRVKPEPA
jgi:two-component system torCAD operon response regulator TorR